MPVCGEAVKELFIAGSGRLRLTHHYNIQSVEFPFVRAKGLANDSLEAVSLNRQPAVLLCDRQTQPGAFVAVRSRQDSKHFVPAPVRFFENALKGVSVKQAIISRKSLARRVFLLLLVVCRNGGRSSATATAARALSRGGASG